MNGGTRTCTKCGDTKPLAEYYFRNGKPIAACKNCTKAARRQYVGKHHEEVKASLRAWHHANRKKAVARSRDYWAENAEWLRAQKREHYAANRDKILAATVEYAERHPEKISARKLATTAILRGDLAPEPCLFCDDPASEAHHHDYALPLSVTWLCKRHHGLAHRTADRPEVA